MAPKAEITSLDALKAFRENLIIYVSKARPTLEEVSSDVMRTRLWLENDQRTHWEGSLKRRLKILEEAQANLFSSKMSNLREVSASEQMAVLRAKRSVDEAREKLRTVKIWDREYPNKTDPLERQMGKLHSIIAIELAQAIQYLNEVIATLEEYTAISLPPGAADLAAPENQPTQTATEAPTAVPQVEPAVPTPEAENSNAERENNT